MSNKQVSWNNSNCFSFLFFTLNLFAMAGREREKFAVESTLLHILFLVSSILFLFLKNSTWTLSDAMQYDYAWV